MNHREHFREAYLLEVIQAASANAVSGKGGPFAAMVIKDNEVVGRGINRVLEKNDPTAHAEVEAIREACKNLGSFQLQGCYLYTSCEPCPMCLGSIYWARPEAVFYAAGREDAAGADFDDSLIYEELTVPPENRAIPAYRFLSQIGKEPFATWKNNPLKTLY